MPPASHAMASEMVAAVPSGPQLLPIAFDFADLASCQALVDQTLDRFGRIDILVNVATAGGENTADRRGRMGVVAPGLRGQRHRDHGAEPPGRPRP